MARAVALNVNVLLRTFIKTLGMLTLMISLSWKLTLLMLMETPLTGLLQNIYDTLYQVLFRDSSETQNYWPCVCVETCDYEGRIFEAPLYLYRISYFFNICFLTRNCQRRCKTLLQEPVMLPKRRCQVFGQFEVLTQRRASHGVMTTD